MFNVQMTALAVVFALQAAPVPLQPLAPPDTDVIGVARDGRSAVVRVNTRQRGVAPIYRSVELPSGRVLSEWRTTVLDNIPLESLRDGGGVRPGAGTSVLQSAGFRSDVARRHSALSPLRESNDNRFAAASGAAVFNVGDWLYASDAGGGRPVRVVPSAAYGPTVSPDGRRVAFTQIVGRLDGVVGNYVLHLLELGSNRVTRISGTRDVWYDDLAWSPDGRYVFARMGSELPEGGCLVRAETRPPYRVERLACVDAQERIDFLAFSPSRTWAVVKGGVRSASTTRHSLQWVQLATGTVFARTTIDGVLSVGGVNDAGLVVAQTSEQRVLTLDPSARTARESVDRVIVPLVFYNAAWVTPTSYAIGNLGTARVVELSQLRWFDRPWR